MVDYRKAVDKALAADASGYEGLVKCRESLKTARDELAKRRIAIIEEEDHLGELIRELGAEINSRVTAEREAAREAARQEKQNRRRRRGG